MLRREFSRAAEDLIGLCQRASFSPAQDRLWLVLDDLGAERLTDWATEVLFRVFNARYTTRAHTLVVSNVQPDDIPEPRLRSRFLDAGLCQVVPNAASDYRQCKRRSKMAQ
jgi:DNA replication protein DnaC